MATNIEWAMKMIPVLIYWAQEAWDVPHYYSDLKKAIGHTTNQLGNPLGRVHDIIEELSAQSGRTIPTLNSLVRNKADGVPSRGFDYVSSTYSRLSDESKDHASRKLNEIAHNYNWEWVLNALDLAPYKPLRTYWVLASNNKKFRLSDLLKEREVVDWKQRYSFSEGDIVFMYCTAPESRIRYMFRVVRTEITKKDYLRDDDFWEDKSEIKTGLDLNRFVRLKLVAQVAEDDNRLTNEVLKSKGLSASFQGGFKIAPGEILNYILGVFGEKEDNDSNLMPEEVSQAYYEGAQQTVTVNRYERDLRARLECIKTHGCRCAVCNLDFGELYGEIGKGFIHVHHIVPIHTIGEEYQLDPKTDLVPVCPNCHAMLHRGMKGEARSVEELKAMLGIEN